MADNKVRTRKRCGCCNEYLDSRTFRLHYKNNYDTKTRRWRRMFDYSSDEENCSSLNADRHQQHDERAEETENCGLEQEESGGVSSEEDANLSSAESSDSEWAYMEQEVQQIPPEVWNITEEDINCDFIEEGQLPYAEVNNQAHQKGYTCIARWAMIFLCLWVSFCSISDNALDILLAFLRGIMESLGTIFPMMTSVAILFPRSVHLFRKCLGIDKDRFVKYVVCKSCNSLYSFNDCFIVRNGNPITKQCSHVAFPHHRQAFRRTACNAPLLKEVTLKNGRTRLYPFKVYCYNSVIKTLQQFLQRPGFAVKCELWRNRDTPAGFLADVFDGRVWQEWQYVDADTPYLARPYNYVFMLNVDWFQPFKHSIYSVGVLYMVLMNLPRAERFRPENVFLVGVIPGPHEPRHNINSFLKPLVAELGILWSNGIHVHLPDTTGNTAIHAALLCVGCDVPATRKLCGFTGHSACKGCSKCTKSFPGSVAIGMDYSGFDPEPPRTNAKHRENAQDILNQTTVTDQAAKEKQYGVRFSELLLLPYFDCIRFHIIDPMHCLFTGTAKHIMQKIWLDAEKPLLTKKDLSTIQSKLDKIKAPSSIGRMPRKIENSYGGFTADQWKTWTVLFSIYSLWDILPQADLEVWRNFVMACSLFCAPMITQVRAELAHSYIINFGKGVELLYGKGKVTPNMHLQTHILDCILDFGPVYSFWLFSFERYNGILGEFTTNQRSVEMQIMRKFTSDLYVKDMPLPLEFRQIFLPILNRLTTQQSGTLDVSIQENNLSSRTVIETSLLSIGPVRPSDNWEVHENDHMYYCCTPQTRGCLNANQLEQLQESYAAIFPGFNPQSVTRFFDRFASVSVAGERFGSSDSRGERSSFVTARWCGFGGRIDKTGADLRPGVVDYFMQQNIEVNGTVVICILAAVRWFQKHHLRHALGAPTEIWCKNMFEIEGGANFIPIQRIHSRFIPAFETIQREHVLVACPLPRKLQC